MALIYEAVTVPVQNLNCNLALHYVFCSKHQGVMTMLFVSAAHNIFSSFSFKKVIVKVMDVEKNLKSKL